MSKAIRCLATLAFVVCASASTASAAMVEFTANLKGENEVPPVTTDAEGLALLVLDTSSATNDFELIVLAEDIDLANLIGAHIHVAPPGVNGPVIVSLGAPTSFRQIGGVLFTQFQGSFPQTDPVVAPGLDLIDELFAGNTYVNIHTVANPGGEIRGQLVPEPATLALLGVGLVAGLVHRRRR